MRLFQKFLGLLQNCVESVLKLSLADTVVLALTDENAVMGKKLFILGDRELLPDALFANRIMTRGAEKCPLGGEANLLTRRFNMGEADTSELGLEEFPIFSQYFRGKAKGI